jgi:uncharacterized protein DUF4232
MGESSGMTRNMPRVTAVRALVVLVPAAAFAVAVVGSVNAGWAATSTDAKPATSGSVKPATSTGAKPGTPARPVAGCLTDDLAGTVLGQPRVASSGERKAVLRLTNASGRTCQVRGWPAVAMVTPPGELVPVPTRQVGRGGGVVVLKPGATAWAPIQWDSCDAGRKGCGVGVALQYIVDPDSTGAVADLAGVPEAERDGITMKALRVGPLQPAPTAVRPG